jgi:hypothetical protein
MDEILEVAELLTDSGLEGVLVWLLRVVGALAVVAGIVTWLLTDLAVVIPAALVVGGVLLLLVPGVLVALTEGV